MHRHIAIIACTLLALCLFPHPAARASDEDIWMESARRDAERDGYRIMDVNELARLIDAKTPALILDARADYEFAAGHVPTAVNFEFDLGDRSDLSPAKRDALLQVLGPDKKRLLVIYCRSFR